MTHFCGIVRKFAAKLRKIRNRMDKRYIWGFCMMLVTALSLTSCLTDDSSEVNYTNDTAITAFSVSCVNRYVHKKTTSGADTIVKLTVTSSLPVFTIDQYKKEVYNTTSLPSDCDLKHVLVSITSKNSGVIVLKSLTSDSLYYYSSTDSIDFSQPREIRVMAPDGSTYRAYTVNINAKAASNSNVVWEEMGPESVLPSVISQNYSLKKGEGIDFEFSKDGGNSWSAERIGYDEKQSLLPDTDIAWLSFSYTASVNTDYELMVGGNDNDASASVVWRKLVDKDLSQDASWVYVPKDPANKYVLPKMSNISLAWFNDQIIALGSDSKFYESRDQGITWKVSTQISLPEGADATCLKMATDAEGNLWLWDATTDKRWKGQLAN